MLQDPRNRVFWYIFKFRGGGFDKNLRFFLKIHCEGVRIPSSEQERFARRQRDICSFNIDSGFQKSDAQNALFYAPH